MGPRDHKEHDGNQVSGTPRDGGRATRSGGPPGHSVSGKITLSSRRGLSIPIGLAIPIRPRSSKRAKSAIQTRRSILTLPWPTTNTTGSRMTAPALETGGRK